MRRITVLLAAAALPAFLTPAPARAQESDVLEDEAQRVQFRLGVVRALESIIADAEAARLRGDCARVEELRYRFSVRMTTSLSSEVRSDLEQRMLAVYSADCPPRLDPPPSAAPAVATDAISAVDFVDEVPAPSREREEPPPPDPEARAQSYLGPDAPLRDRLSEAYHFFGYALDGEGEYSPQAWLNTLRDLVEEAERQARGARVFGNLSTVDPEEARLLSEGARSLLNDAEQAFDDSLAPETGPAEPPPEADTPAAPESVYQPGIRRLLELSVYGDLTRLDLPETGIGVQREGAPGTAPESFAGATSGKVTTYGGGGSLSLPWLTIGLSYQEGEAANDFTVPGGSGIDSGIVYGALSPGGSSGIITPFGLSGETEVDYKAFTLFGARRLANRSMLNERRALGALFGIDVSAYGGYTRVERDYMGLARYAGASGGFVFQFSQERAQSIDEDFFEAGLRGTVSISLGASLTGHIFGSSGLYYRQTELDSFERNMSNFGPLEDRDFTIEMQQSDNGFGYHGSLGAGLSVAVGGNVTLGVAGAVEYRSDIGAIFNPSSGDQVFFDGLSTELTTGHVWARHIRIGARLRF